MAPMDAATWKTYGEAYAFLGNTLLKPMTQTASVGLDPAFWAAFPDFGSAEVAKRLEDCGRYALEEGDGASDDAVTRVSVEYTRLFVGPPSPAAAPWETMYRSENVTVGFGEATFEMRRLLREAGLRLSNENNQYEDHMGIELLYLSVLCSRLSEGLQAEGRAGEPSLDVEAAVREIEGYIAERPLSWIGRFRDRVAESFPEGYFVGILGLAEAILRASLEA